MLDGKKYTVPFDTRHAYLKAMIERYAFYLTGSRQNVEDISQDVFLKLWIKWSRLCELDKEKLEDYIYVMVKNQVVNMGKRTVVQRKYFKYYKMAGSEACWHDDVLLAEGLRIYKAAVNHLPEKERRVYVFHDNNYKASQIAEVMQRSENTINNQLCSAGKTVKIFLNKNFDLNIQRGERRKSWKSTSLN